MRMVQASGVDPEDVCIAAGPQFEVCEYVVVEADGSVADADGDGDGEIEVGARTPLDRYSLRGRSGDVERNVADQVFVLEPIALAGQLTAFYAEPNTGKTLITLYLLIEAIRRGRVDPDKAYYFNADDDANGLLTKLLIAEEYGFHMLADGYRGLSTTGFVDLLREMVEDDQARGIVVVLDTLKKFFDLMDKKHASAFLKVARQFVVKGGTIIGLAHTNKHPGPGGRPVYAGTTDVRDDSDCVFTLRQIDAAPGGLEKTVVFENIKRRGNVATEAGFRYSIEGGITYSELLASVRPFQTQELVVLKQIEATRTDADLIAVVEACVGDGINTKMRLADAVAERAKVSKRTAIRIIEKYTGDVPAEHRWTFCVRARGAKVYRLIGSPSQAAEGGGLDPIGGPDHV